MNKRLLHRTLRAYLLYSLLILIIAAPVFYYATQKLYLKEADDTLLLHKKEFTAYAAHTMNETDIADWNKFNRNRKIAPIGNFLKDTFYNTTYYDSLDAELEPYRELQARVIIQGKTYAYSGRINLVESEDIIKSIGFLFLAIIFTLLIGLFFITKKLSLSLWKPFYKTLEQIESFEIDKTKQPQFSKTEIEEFYRLNTSIERLIDKNTAIHKTQKEFIENAAHELQTPLAVFQAKIDALIQRADITKGQAVILDSLNENVSRLNRLNKNLLLLSKMENDIYGNKQTISITACVQKNIDFFTEQAKAKNLTIRIDSEEDFKITSNSVLADVLISNLFLNSLKHNMEGGQIHVVIEECKLTFSNTGQSIPLTTNKLFNRFSKASPSEQGTGLGLSLIKKIANINNWLVSYNYENNRHSFSISF
ncbi:MAG: HAMP domain-containing sensor histidine kinase [Chitinophagaceae bacterium]